MINLEKNCVVNGTFYLIVSNIKDTYTINLFKQSPYSQILAYFQSDFQKDDF